MVQLNDAAPINSIMTANSNSICVKSPPIPLVACSTKRSGTATDLQFGDELRRTVVQHGAEVLEAGLSGGRQTPQQLQRRVRQLRLAEPRLVGGAAQEPAQVVPHRLRPVGRRRRRRRRHDERSAAVGRLWKQPGELLGRRQSNCSTTATTINIRCTEPSLGMLTSHCLGIK